MTILEHFSEICFYVAIVATLVFVIKTFLPVEFGPEVSGDFTSIIDSDASFNLFSIESVAAFFMCSGWIGWLSHSQLHYSLKISIGIALLCGFIGMFLFAYLIAQFRKLEEVNKTDNSTLVGKTGKAYLTFAPNGNGKIQIETESSLEVLDAVNLSNEEIKSFENIKVVKFENNKLYIEKE